MNENILLIIMGALLIALGFCISQIYDLYKFDNSNMKSEVKQNCSNLDLFSTADCLNNQLKTFFKYNISNLNEELNLSELKRLGGVCKHYTDFYYDNIDNENFYKEKVLIRTSNNTRHTFLIISDETGYCILDQEIKKCYELQ